MSKSTRLMADELLMSERLANAAEMRREAARHQREALDKLERIRTTVEKWQAKLAPMARHSAGYSDDIVAGAKAGIRAYQRVLDLIDGEEPK